MCVQTMFLDTNFNEIGAQVALSKPYISTKFGMIHNEIGCKKGKRSGQELKKAWVKKN